MWFRCNNNLMLNGSYVKSLKPYPISANQWLVTVVFDGGQDFLPTTYATEAEAASAIQAIVSDVK